MLEVEPGDRVSSPRKKSGLSLEEFYEEFQTLVKDPEDRVSILTGRSHKSGKSEGRQISGGDEEAKMAEQVSPDDFGSLIDHPDVVLIDMQEPIKDKDTQVVINQAELMVEEGEYDDRSIRPADDDEVEKEYAYKAKATEKEGGKTELVGTKTETVVATKEGGGGAESKTESGGEKTESSWTKKTEVSWRTKTETSSGEKRSESGGGEKRSESGGEKRTESGGEKRTESGGEKRTESGGEKRTESGGEKRTDSGEAKRTEGSWRKKTEVSWETKTERSAGEQSGGGKRDEKTTEIEGCHQCNLMESSWGKRIESDGKGGRKDEKTIENEGCRCILMESSWGRQIESDGKGGRKDKKTIENEGCRCNLMESGWGKKIESGGKGGREEGTAKEIECEDVYYECRCTATRTVIDHRSTYNEHDTAEPFPDDLIRVLVERERHFKEEEEERRRKISEFSCKPKVSKKRTKRKRKKRLETTSEKRRREESERRRRNKEAVEAWTRKKNIERKKIREIERTKTQEDEKQCVMLKLMRNPQLAYQAFLRAKKLERLKNYPKRLTFTCESFEIWLQRCFKRRYNMESFMNW